MIRRLLFTLRMMRTFCQRWPLAAQEEPKWEDTDAAALARFLAGSTGRKLIAKMRYAEQSGNSQAVYANTRQEWACGWAAGQRGAFAWIFTLSQAGADTGETETHSNDGDADVLDRLSP